MTPNDAKAFVDYNIKEGIYDPDMFNGWTDEQYVEFAQKESERGDAYFESLKEEHI